jgi:predicted nicotinamide N-methyase
LENPYNAMDTNTTKAAILRWGSRVDEFCNWCQQTFPGDTNKFDVILAGDVMYKQELPKLFFETVHSLLRSETGTLWLCHVPRAQVTHDVVRTAAQEFGFDIEEFDSSDIRVEKCPMHDRDRAIVYQVVRKR